MNTPLSAIQCVANLFCKQMVFEKAGDVEHGHAHCFDHTTLLAHGGLDVKVGGVVTHFEAPQMIFIKAGTVHELTATKDGTVAFCIHALRDGDGVGDIIDPNGVPKGVQQPLIEMGRVLAKADDGKYHVT